MMPSEKNTERVILALDQAYEKFIQLEDDSTDEAEIVAHRCYSTNIYESKLYVEQMQKEIERLNDLLKEQQPKWIPVDERLPEEDGHYLVCNHGFIPWIAELKTFMGIRGWCNGANMPVVKMWMPLPKTPEAGEQE